MAEIEVDWQQMYDNCERALKDADDGAELPVWGWRQFLIIDYGWDAEWYEKWEQTPGWRGTVRIEKGSWRPGDHGSLTFTGAHDRAELEQTIAQFSKKEVHYTD